MAIVLLACLNGPSPAQTNGGVTSPLRQTSVQQGASLIRIPPFVDGSNQAARSGKLVAIGPHGANPFDRPASQAELRGGRVTLAHLVEPVQPYVPVKGTAIRIKFDRPVNQSTVERSFQVEPAVDGALSWADDRTLIFAPRRYALDTTYTVRIGATDEEDELVGGWQWSFLTVKGITLTFDDCGTVTQLKTVLSVLAEKHIKAIMFPIGWCASQYPWLVPQMLAEGHTVCNHTYSHPRLTYLSDAQMASEIQRGVHTGCNLLRPPDGNWDGPGGRVERIAASQGFHIYMWDVDTYDYLGNNAADMLNRIYARGGVILMHFHGAHTIEAVRQLPPDLQVWG